MDKPTIFFSHSSNDRDTIFPIKEKIDDITGKSLNIFMSSDGQSIPFGHNWVHKIEEGLKNSQIMFVFVTPNSINSAWIYFEAGYAYSKGVEVIPVGIGVNIGQLKAPLNLLQGFDVLSVDSLNNFVSIINKKFRTSFKEDFSEESFGFINEVTNGILSNIKLSNAFSYAQHILYSQYENKEDKTNIIRYDIEKIFNGFREYLNKNKIPYSFGNNVLLVSGIKISHIGKEREPKINSDGTISINHEHRLAIKVSLYNFKESISLLQLLFKFVDVELKWLNLYFTDDYIGLTSDEDISSIISKNKDIFTYHSKGVGFFKFKSDLEFSLHLKDSFIHTENNFKIQSTMYLNIQLNKETNSIQITDLLYRLIENNIIYKTLPN